MVSEFLKLDSLIHSVFTAPYALGFKTVHTSVTMIEALETS